MACPHIYTSVSELSVDLMAILINSVQEERFSEWRSVVHTGILNMVFLVRPLQPMKHLFDFFPPPQLAQSLNSTGLLGAGVPMHSGKVCSSFFHAFIFPARAKHTCHAIPRVHGPGRPRNHQHDAYGWYARVSPWPVCSHMDAHLRHMHAHLRHA